MRYIFVVVRTKVATQLCVQFSLRSIIECRRFSCAASASVMLACFWKHTAGSGQVYQPLLPGAIQRFAGSQKLIQTLNNQLQQQMLPGLNGVRHFWNPDPAVMFLSGWILYLSMPKPSKQLWAVFMSWFVTQGSLRSALTLHWHLNRQDPTSGSGGWSFREFGFTLAALGSAEGFCASPFAVVLRDLARDRKIMKVCL